jgi:hypothetical protein
VVAAVYHLLLIEPFVLNSLMNIDGGLKGRGRGRGRQAHCVLDVGNVMTL